jgi:cytochrome b
MPAPRKEPSMSTTYESPADVQAAPAALRTLVWDAPVRVFHWLMVFAFAGAYLTAESERFRLVHVTLGYTMAGLVAFRLVWGLVGTDHARFASFVRGPRAISDDLRGRWRGIGHSPLGALSVLALLLVVAVQVGLGLLAQDEDGIYAGPLSRLISSDASDRARDLHESWFNVILALIVLHVAAIVYYRLRGRKLTLPMITGRAPLTPGTAPMRPGKWWVALLCLGAGIVVTRWVIAGAPPFSP